MKSKPEKVVPMNHRSLQITLATLVVLALLVTACAPVTTPTSTARPTTPPAPIPTPVPPTATSPPAPTPTPVPPTDTPAPTATPTLLPTDTPVPTATPTALPTDTPVPPTATPVPLSALGQIAFMSWSQREGPQIYVMNADGSNAQCLTSGLGWQGPLSWSPDGKYIACPRGGDIWVMDADGSNPRNLTNYEAGDQEPAWSPDGQYIAFSSNRAERMAGQAYAMDIFVMGADGSDPHNLTDSTTYDTYPAWSPDGRHIVFQSDRDGNQDIYVMAADGSNPRNLTNHEGNDFVPAWSPDGRHIAFDSDRDGDREIYVMAADGSNLRVLTDNEGMDGLPTWSPDGRYIAFQSDRDGGSQEIYVMEVETGNVQRLTEHKAFMAAWSPPPYLPPETFTGPSGQPLVALYGQVVRLPDKYPFDDYLSSNGAGGYIGCGVTGANAETEAAIEALRVEKPGQAQGGAHFWGTISYGVDDYETCQLLVTRQRPDGPGPFFDPDPVEGWEGIIVSTQPEAQFDDYFILAGDFSLGYGIDSSDPTLAAQLESLRDTGTTIRVWGQLSAGVPDVNGTQIQVSRIEVLEKPPPPPPPEGWASYVNAEYGFAFHYPPTWAIEEVSAWEDARGKWAPSVKVSQGTLTLVIGYMRTTEDVLIEGGGAAGSIVPGGSITFLGQELRRRVLVFEGKDKSVYYATDWIQSGDLVFRIALHDFAADYQAIDIPKELQAEVDQIVESFELTQ